MIMVTNEQVAWFHSLMFSKRKRIVENVRCQVLEVRLSTALHEPF